MHRLSWIAVLPLLLLVVSCERTANSIVDPRGTAPVLGHVTVAPASVNTDTINIGPVRDPSDLLTIPLQVTGTLLTPAISAVQYDVRFDGDEFSLVSGALPVSDSLFAGTISVSFTRVRVGRLLIRLSAAGSQGDLSTQAIGSVNILRLNHPPVISLLSAPDTVAPSRISQFVITLRASDPDGAQDLASVFRTSQSGRMFPLNDNGANGDAVAGDGTYTETVSLAPAPAAGTYLFTFRAVDRSADTSNVLSKTIVVLP